MPSVPNFNNTTPAAPAGNQNVTWQSDGAANISAYLPVGGGGTTVTKTANYTAVAADSGNLLSFNSAGAVTLTLPASPPSTTWEIDVEDIGAGTLTVNPNGKNLDGSASNLSVPTNSGLRIFTDGTNYFTQRGMGGAAGVSSLNALTGALSITAGANITVTPSGSNIQIAASGGGAAIPPQFSGGWYSWFQNNITTGFLGLPFTLTAGSQYDTCTKTTNIASWTGQTAAGSTSPASSEIRSSVVNTPAGYYGTGTGGNPIWSFAYRVLNFAAEAYIARITDQLWYCGLFQSTAVGSSFAGTTVGLTIGAYFRFDTTAGDTQIQCITSDGSTKVTTSSGNTPVANTAHIYGIQVVGGTSATFYIDGTQVAQNTTHLPTGSAEYQVSTAWASAQANPGMGNSFIFIQQ